MFPPIKLLAQVNLVIQVEDPCGVPIPRVSITVAELGENMSWKGGGLTDGEGKLNLSLPTNAKFRLDFHAMGFLSKRYDLELPYTISDSIVYIQLDFDSLRIQEVLIPIREPSSRSDDITYIDVENILKGEESTLEDLLRNIVGLRVDALGLIKVGQQPIHTILIEGDDFLGGNYAFLSKNLPALAVKQIQINRAYKDNPVLAKFKDSNSIVLNLVLADDFKRKWFGKVEAQLSPENISHYQVHEDLMNVGPKWKLYTMGSTSTVEDVYRQRAAISSSTFIDEGSELFVPPALSLVNPLPIHLPELYARNDRFEAASVGVVNLKHSVNERLNLGLVLASGVSSVEQRSKSSEQLNGSPEEQILLDTSTTMEKFRPAHAQFHTSYQRYDVFRLQGVSTFRSDAYLQEISSIHHANRSFRPSKDKQIGHEHTYLFSSRLNNRIALNLLISGYSGSNVASSSLPLFPRYINNLGYEGVGDVNLEGTSEGWKVESDVFHKNFNKGGRLHFKIAYLQSMEFAKFYSPSHARSTHVSRETFNSDRVSVEVFHHFNVRKAKISSTVGLKSAGAAYERIDTALHLKKKDLEYSIKIQRDWSQDWKVLTRFSKSFAWPSLVEVSEVDRYHSTAMWIRGTGFPFRLPLYTGVVNAQYGGVNKNTQIVATFYYVYSPSGLAYRLSHSGEVWQIQSELGPATSSWSYSLQIDRYLSLLSTNVKLDWTREWSKSYFAFFDSRMDGRQVKQSNLKAELNSIWTSTFRTHLGVEWSFDLAKIDQVSLEGFYSKLFMDMRFRLRESLNFSLRNDCYITRHSVGGRRAYLLSSASMSVKLSQRTRVTIDAKNLSNEGAMRTVFLSQFGRKTVDRELFPRNLQIGMSYRI